MAKPIQPKLPAMLLLRELGYLEGTVRRWNALNLENSAGHETVGRLAPHNVDPAI